GAAGPPLRPPAGRLCGCPACRLGPRCPVAARPRRPYSPRNVGARFSRNARTPSCASAVRRISRKSLTSSLSPTSRGTLSARSTLALAAARALVGPCASLRPYSITRSAKPSAGHASRSEEHTSELQSRENLVCRLLLEKKNQQRHSI